MSIIARILEARKRRRSHSLFDSAARDLVRRLERKIKFLISNPLGAMLRPRRTKTPLSLSEVTSVLIFRYDALGDAVLTTPVWRTIKKYAPHIKVGVAGSLRNQQLLRADPDIDEVYLFSREPSLLTLKELFRARKTRWDVVMNLVFHDKTRGAIYAKVISPQGISATSVMSHMEKYQRIYSVVGLRPRTTPVTAMVRLCLLVLKDVLDVPIDVTQVFPSLPEFREVAPAFSQELARLMESYDKDDYIIINTDSSQSYREWGIENSIALGKEIVTLNPRRHVFFSSAPQRSAPLKEVLQAGNDMSYLETPSVLHLAVAIRGAVAVVSPDTSVVHFATAERVPVVGLYVGDNEFWPYGSASKVVLPPDGKTLSLIPVTEVLAAYLELVP